MTYGYYLLQVSGCLAVFYTLYHLFFRKETFSQLNRAYLLVSLFLAFCIPIMPATMTTTTTLNWLNPTTLEWTQNDQNIITPIILLPEDVTADSNPTTSMGGAFWIGLLYLSGGVVMLIKLLLNLGKIIWQIKRSTVIKKDGFYLVKSHQPMVCSFFNYIFWNDKLSFSPSEKQQLLAHELAHVKDKHSFDIILLEIMTIILWFNPFIYLYKQALRHVHEYIADHFVFYHLNFKTDYAQLLIKEASLSLAPLPVAHHFFNSLTKNRLIMLSKTTQPFRKLKMLAIVPIIACLLMLFGLDQTAIAQNQNGVNAQEKKEQTKTKKKDCPEDVICLEDKVRFLLTWKGHQSSKLGNTQTDWSVVDWFDMKGGKVVPLTSYDVEIINTDKVSKHTFSNQGNNLSAEIMEKVNQLDMNDCLRFSNFRFELDGETHGSNSVFQYCLEFAEDPKKYARPGRVYVNFKGEGESYYNEKGKRLNSYELRQKAVDMYAAKGKRLKNSDVLLVTAEQMKEISGFSNTFLFECLK